MGEPILEEFAKFCKVCRRSFQEVEHFQTKIHLKNKSSLLFQLKSQVDSFMVFFSEIALSNKNVQEHRQPLICPFCDKIVSSEKDKFAWSVKHFKDVVF